MNVNRWILHLDIPFWWLSLIIRVSDFNEVGHMMAVIGWFQTFGLKFDLGLYKIQIALIWKWLKQIVSFWNHPLPYLDEKDVNHWILHLGIPFWWLSLIIRVNLFNEVGHMMAAIALLIEKWCTSLNIALRHSILMAKFSYLGQSF